MLPKNTNPTDVSSEVVLGFDARVTPALWSLERRRAYLLRDVEMALSVDSWVWPSARNTKLRGDIETDLRVVVDYVKSLPSEIETWIIAITLQKTPQQKAFSEWGLGSDIDSNWQLLGYDVADQAMLSGLTNCEYNKNEIEQLRPLWSARLNGYHLFSEASYALEFTAITDSRVPEHAPFAVYGLYRIR